MRGNLVPSASASRRVDGDAYVATPAARRTSTPPTRSSLKVRGDCALREVQFAFQSPREVPLCFRTPRCINQKQLITITDNETIGRVDHAIKQLRCDMRPNTIGNLVKSDLSDRNFVDCRILTTRLPGMG